jgi:hypothetical protein
MAKLGFVAELGCGIGTSWKKTSPSILARKVLFLRLRPRSVRVVGHLGHTLTFLLPLCHQMLNAPSA